MKDTVKSYNKAIDKKEDAEAKDLHPRVQKMLDKAAKNGIIKKGTASRRKSRLSRKLNALTAPDVETSK